MVRPRMILSSLQRATNSQSIKSIQRCKPQQQYNNFQYSNFYYQKLSKEQQDEKYKLGANYMYLGFGAGVIALLCDDFLLR